MIMWLLVGILLVLLGVLFFVVDHRWQLQEIEERLDKNPVDNEDHLKAVMKRESDATRAHVSTTVDSIRNDTKLTKQRIYDFTDEQKRDNNEFRGQLTAQKTRLQWMMGVIDALTKELRALTKKVYDWFNSSPKPPKDDTQ